MSSIAQRLAVVLCVFLLIAGCSQQAGETSGQVPPGNAGQSPNGGRTPPSVRTVPQQGTWGIYALDLASGDVELVYGTTDEIYASALRLNNAGDRFVFAQKTGGDANENLEIFTLGTDGSGLRRITDNRFWDLYPAWSPDGNSIAFLSKRDMDLDIYVMNSDGSDERKLYDSGDNDADIDWAGNRIVFTTGFRIWGMDDDGTHAVPITAPANSGQWGTANLPIGDYDPRLSQDGAKVVFERLEDPNAANGAYNLFVINSDGTGETRLTNTGFAQGLASWSRSGQKIVYVVAAINGQGKYHIYMMNADGTDNRDIIPDYFPPGFLCHSPIFSKDDSKIYFIGQWWS